MKTLKDYEYYRTVLGVLYCGDNKDILPLITEPIDLVLTDPPYGIHIDKMYYTNSGNKKMSKNSVCVGTDYGKTFNDSKIDIKPLLTMGNYIIWGGELLHRHYPGNK